MKAKRRFPLLCRVVSLVTALSLVSGGVSSEARAHPLHTTLGEVAYSPTTGTVRVTLRVFADDFATAVSRERRARVAAGQAPAGSTAAYLSRYLRLRGSNGRPVPLGLTAMRRQGDVFWITLHGAAPAGLEGGSIWSGLLFDLFADQVNIVKVNRGRGERSLIFVPGDGPKRIL